MPSKIKRRGKDSYLLSIPAGYSPDGKQKVFTKTVKCTSRQAAEREYALFLAEIERGQVATSGKMTLDEYYQYWLENYANRQHAPKTISYNNNLYQRVRLALGHKRISQIEPKHLLEFYSNLLEPGIRQDNRKTANKALSPNTVRKYHILLHSLFEKAVKWQLIAYNPADKVEPPKSVKFEKKIYDEQTLGSFILALEKEDLRHKTMALLALSSGMRRGELFALQWKHVDIETNTVRIEQASQYLPNKGIFLKEPKNESSKRIITIPAGITALLKQYKAQQLAKRLQLGNKWEGAAEPENDFIFTSWNGKMAHPDSLNTWLTKFTTKNNLPHISSHTFRHMAASYLITCGTDLRTVAGKLGHANTTTTTVVYSHLLRTAEQETANKMEKFLQQTVELAKKNKQA